MSKTPGQIGYDAYGDHAKWAAWDGRPMPRWDEVRPDIKEKWEVAAKAILSDFLANACRQCRNPEEDGICWGCGRGV
jgi:hypothetical protein